MNTEKVDFCIKDIEERILLPLNEILVLSYGTEVYRQILLNIERIIHDLERRRLLTKIWQ